MLNVVKILIHAKSFVQEDEHCKSYELILWPPPAILVMEE